MQLSAFGGRWVISTSKDGAGMSCGMLRTGLFICPAMPVKYNRKRRLRINL